MNTTTNSGAAATQATSGEAAYMVDARLIAKHYAAATLLKDTKDWPAAVMLHFSDKGHAEFAFEVLSVALTAGMPTATPAPAASTATSVAGVREAQGILNEYAVFADNYKNDSLVQAMAKALATHPAAAPDSAQQGDYWQTRAMRAENMLEASAEARADFLERVGRKYEADRLRAAGAERAVPEVVRDMAEFIAAHAVADHLDTNGPDWRACACCGAEIPINSSTYRNLQLEHKDDCLLLKAQAMLAASPSPAAAKDGK